MADVQYDNLMPLTLDDMGDYEEWPQDNSNEKGVVRYPGFGITRQEAERRAVARIEPIAKPSNTMLVSASPFIKTKKNRNPINYLYKKLWKRNNDTDTENGVEVEGVPIIKVKGYPLSESDSVQQSTSLGSVGGIKRKLKTKRRKTRKIRTRKLKTKRKTRK